LAALAADAAPHPFIGWLKPVQKSGRGHQSIEWCDPNECLRLFIPERVMTAIVVCPMP
jgi:hypothetical protein